MPEAPSPPPHTPVLFTLAGDMKGFTKECKAALAKMGFEPDDFGTHKAVQAKISEARDKRKKTVANHDPKDGPPPPEKDAHEAMLQRSQSGHLSQDAMFHEPGAKRGDACKNRQPEADCYDTNLAPTMPMQTNDGPDGGQSSIGSPHWGVGASERQQRADNPGTVDPTALQKMSEDNVKIALGGTNEKSKTKFDSAIDGLKKQGKVSAEDRQAAAKARQATSATIQQASAQAVEAKGGTGDKSGSSSDDKDLAGKCIEAFRQVMLEEMRRESVKKFGENYDDTKTAAEDKKKAAEAKFDAAVAKKKATQEEMKAETDPAKKEALKQRGKDEGREIGKAKRERAEARMEADNVDCMHEQARRACGQPPPPPNANFPAPRTGDGNIGPFKTPLEGVNPAPPPKP